VSSSGETGFDCHYKDQINSELLAFLQRSRPAAAWSLLAQAGNFHTLRRAIFVATRSHRPRLFAG